MMTLVKRLAIAAPISVTLSLVAVVGPDEIEGSLFPVAKTVSIRIYHRDPTTICWVQDLLKIRDVRYRFFNWTVAANDKKDEVYAVAAFDPMTPQSPTALRGTAASPDVQSLNQCFTLPGPLAGDTTTSLRFSALGLYPSVHRFWLVPRRIEVEVQGTSSATLLK
jgi:hypothetical protein